MTKSSLITVMFSLVNGLNALVFYLEPFKLKLGRGCFTGFICLLYSSNEVEVPVGYG